jgi:hypothetical protein
MICNVARLSSRCVLVLLQRSLWERRRSKWKEVDDSLSSSGFSITSSSRNEGIQIERYETRSNENSAMHRRNAHFYVPELTPV